MLRPNVSHHTRGGGLTVGPRTAIWAVVVLAIMTGALGYSLGCDAARMVARATAERAAFVALPP